MIPKTSKTGIIKSPKGSYKVNTTAKVHRQPKKSKGLADFNIDDPNKVGYIGNKPIMYELEEKIKNEVVDEIGGGGGGDSLPLAGGVMDVGASMEIPSSSGNTTYGLITDTKAIIANYIVEPRDFTYPQNSIIVKDGSLYTANNAISGTTPFTIGTTGETWTSLTGNLSDYLLLAGGAMVKGATVTFKNSAGDVMTTVKGDLFQIWSLLTNYRVEVRPDGYWVIDYTLPLASQYRLNFESYGGTLTHTDKISYAKNSIVYRDGKLYDSGEGVSAGVQFVIGVTNGQWFDVQPAQNVLNGDDGSGSNGTYHTKYCAGGTTNYGHFFSTRHPDVNGNLEDGCISWYLNQLAIRQVFDPNIFTFRIMADGTGKLQQTNGLHKPISEHTHIVTNGNLKSSDWVRYSAIFHDEIAMGQAPSKYYLFGNFFTSLVDSGSGEVVAISQMFGDNRDYFTKADITPMRCQRVTGQVGDPKFLKIDSASHLTMNVTDGSRYQIMVIVRCKTETSSIDIQLIGEGDVNGTLTKDVNIAGDKWRVLKSPIVTKQVGTGVRFSLSATLGTDNGFDICGYFFNEI